MLSYAPVTLTCSNDGCVGGIEELGELAVTELLLDWLNPFITRVERDRIVTWNLGVSLQVVVASAMS